MLEERRYRAWKWLLQRLTTRRNVNQIDMITQIDWDVLVILDACRGDVLKQLAQWPIETAASPASCTPEWLKIIAERGVFKNTHVVSANPQYEKTDVKLGCDTIQPYWEEKWDDSLQTVPPEPVLDRATEVSEIRDRQVVAHLEQPHWPYIAKLGGTWKLAYPDVGPWDEDGEEIVSLQVAMQRGHIDIKQAYGAYRASVASTWSTLCKYLQQWHAAGLTIIVTADHGETFGRLRDRKLYEHPCGCHVPPLVKVPWVKLTPQNVPADDGAGVQDRLQALGYVD